MHRLLVAPMLVTLAGCATGSLEPPAANAFASSGPVTALAGETLSAEPGQNTAATVAPEETVDIEELDNGLVCKYEKRPGSRIAEQYCYTREERAAHQEAQDGLVERQMQTLSMEQEARMNRERDLARSRGGVLTY